METGEGGRPERSIDTERWGYESHLKPYLSLLAQKEHKAVEKMQNFPKRIDWGSTVHGVMDKMREESRDGAERITLITYRSDLQDIYVPSEFVKGSRTATRPENPLQAKDWLKRNITLDTLSILGDIHSETAAWAIPAAKLLQATRMTAGGGFSIDDLYHIVSSKDKRYLAGLVDRFDNFYIFRTRETKTLQPESSESSLEAFRHYWLKRHQMTMIGETIIMFRPFDQMWRLNMSIAKEYNLALYQGKPGQDLIRNYPK